MITEKQPNIRLELFEILEAVDKAKTEQDKISVLRNNNKASVTDYLRCVFDDAIQFNLPEGKPPYTPNREESYPSSWHKQNTKLQYLVNTKASRELPGFRRETMFIGILESVHPRDAEILVDMINKKSTTPSLTKELVKEAFPNLIVK